MARSPREQEIHDHYALVIKCLMAMLKDLRVVELKEALSGCGVSGISGRKNLLQATVGYLIHPIGERDYRRDHFPRCKQASSAIQRLYMRKTAEKTFRVSELQKHNHHVVYPVPLEKVRPLQPQDFHLAWDKQERVEPSYLRPWKDWKEADALEFKERVRCLCGVPVVLPYSLQCKNCLSVHHSGCLGVFEEVKGGAWLCPVCVSIQEDALLDLKDVHGFIPVMGHHTRSRAFAFQLSEADMREVMRSTHNRSRTAAGCLQFLLKPAKFEPSEKTDPDQVSDNMRGFHFTINDRYLPGFTGPLPPEGVDITPFCVMGHNVLHIIFDGDWEKKGCDWQLRAVAIVKVQQLSVDTLIPRIVKAGSTPKAYALAKKRVKKLFRTMNGNIVVDSDEDSESDEEEEEEGDEAAEFGVKMGVKQEASGTAEAHPVKKEAKEEQAGAHENDPSVAFSGESAVTRSRSSSLSEEKKVAVPAKKPSRKRQRRDSEEDIMATSTVLSLRCPLGLGRIQVPVRGKNCIHLQCFDLSTYVRFNRSVKTPTWRCPVCNKVVRLGELMVDSYLAKVFAQNPTAVDAKDEIEEVEVFRDATWKWRYPRKRGSDAGTKQEHPSVPKRPKVEKPVTVTSISDSSSTGDDSGDSGTESDSSSGGGSKGSSRSRSNSTSASDGTARMRSTSSSSSSSDINNRRPPSSTSSGRSRCEPVEIDLTMDSSDEEDEGEGDRGAGTHYRGGGGSGNYAMSSKSAGSGSYYSSGGLSTNGHASGYSGSHNRFSHGSWNRGASASSPLRESSSPLGGCAFAGHVPPCAHRLHATKKRPLPPGPFARTEGRSTPGRDDMAGDRSRPRGGPAIDYAALGREFLSILQRAPGGSNIAASALHRPASRTLSQGSYFAPNSRTNTPVGGGSARPVSNSYSQDSHAAFSEMPSFSRALEFLADSSTSTPTASSSATAAAGLASLASETPSDGSAGQRSIGQGPGAPLSQTSGCGRDGGGRVAQSSATERHSSEADEGLGVRTSEYMHGGDGNSVSRSSVSSRSSSGNSSSGHSSGPCNSSHDAYSTSSSAYSNSLHGTSSSSGSSSRSGNGSSSNGSGGSGSLTITIRRNGNSYSTINNGSNGAESDDAAAGFFRSEDDVAGAEARSEPSSGSGEGQFDEAFSDSPSQGYAGAEGYSDWMGNSQEERERQLELDRQLEALLAAGMGDFMDGLGDRQYFE